MEVEENNDIPLEAMNSRLGTEEQPMLSYKQKKKIRQRLKRANNRKLPLPEEPAQKKLKHDVESPSICLPFYFSAEYLSLCTSNHPSHWDYGITQVTHENADTTPLSIEKHHYLCTSVHWCKLCTMHFIGESGYKAHIAYDSHVNNVRIMTGTIYCDICSQYVALHLASPHFEKHNTDSLALVERYVEEKKALPEAELSDSEKPRFELSLLNCTVCPCRVWEPAAELHTQGDFHQRNTSKLVSTHPSLFLKKKCTACVVELEPADWLTHCESNEHLGKAGGAIHQQKKVRPLISEVPNKLQIYCDYCEKSIDDFNWLSHTNGKKHVTRKNEKNNAAAHQATIQPTAPNYYCDICSVAALSDVTWISHLNGKKHRNREILAHNLESTELSGPDSNFFCKFCQLQLLNDHAWQGHVAGKKHARAVKNTEAIQQQFGSIVNNLDGTKTFICLRCPHIVLNTLDGWVKHANGKLHMRNVAAQEAKTSDEPNVNEDFSIVS